MLTAEDVVRRIAAECTYVDDHGGVGIKIKPAAAIVRAYGDQFRMVQLPKPAPAIPRRRRSRQAVKEPTLL